MTERMTERDASRSARQLAIRSLLTAVAVLAALLPLALFGPGPTGPTEAQAQITIFPPPPPEAAFVDAGWDPQPPTRFTGPSMALSGSFTLSGTHTITELELVLTPQSELYPGCDDVSVSEDASAPGPGGTVEFSITAPSSLCNGVYQAMVVATADSGEQGSLSSDGRTVSLQPRAPSGLAAAANASGAVALSWEEPDNAADFLGYRLQRSVDDGPFNPIGPDLLDDTSFDDTEVPDGATAVDYKVASVRQGATEGTTVTALSAATAVSLTPVAPPPSDTATTTVPGDDPGGASTGSNGATTGARPSGTGRSVTPTTQFLPDIGSADDDPLDAEEGDEDAVLPNDEFASGTVLQNFEDDAGDRRALMVPVAIGVVLLVWAMHLRFLARQAAH